MVAGIGGILLILSLFFKWYGFDLSGALGTAFQSQISTSVSGWGALSTGDLFLTLVGLLAIAPAAFDIAGLEIELPVPMSTVSLGGGALAVLYVIYRILDKPGPDVSFGGSAGFSIGLKMGIFIALIGAIVICVGSYFQLGEEDEGSGVMAAAPGAGMPGSVPPQPPVPPQQPPAPPQQPPAPPQQPPAPPTQPPPV